MQECSKNVFASLHKTTSDEVRQIFDSGGLKVQFLNHTSASTIMQASLPLSIQSNATKTRALCDMWDITETGF